MPQRPQHYCLAGVVALVIIMLFTTIWSREDCALYAWFLRPYGDYGVYWPYAMVGSLAAVALLTSTQMLRHDNPRESQVWICIVVLVALVTIIPLFIYFTEQLNKEEMGSYGIGFFVPPVAIVVDLLAIYFIYREEKLVRDSERVR